MPDRVRRMLCVSLVLPLQKYWVAFAVFLCLPVALTSPLHGLSLNQLSHPQRHDARHTIDELEESWRNAMLASDTNALAALLSDDYMAITPSGTLQSKDDALTMLRTGRVHFGSLTTSDRKVRFYGSTAVVTSLVSVQASNTDGLLSGNYRYTHVYARDAQGKWKIVSFEASRVREPGGDHRSEFH